MAKKQTFGDKANSKKNAKDMIKVIKSSKSTILVHFDFLQRW